MPPEPRRASANVKHSLLLTISSAAIGRWSKRALPYDGHRYEVIDGDLFVTPAPSWLLQRAVIELFFQVRPSAFTCALDCLIAPTEVTFAPRQRVHLTS